jgi:hypothetical protein
MHISVSTSSEFEAERAPSTSQPAIPVVSHARGFRAALLDCGVLGMVADHCKGRRLRRRRQTRAASPSDRPNA